MNLSQLRTIREVVRHDFNLTSAASALHTSQSGLSKQIRELEDELGVLIFVRRGKRFLGLTEAGEAMVPMLERLMVEAGNISRIAQEFRDTTCGQLTIATTHTQARYVLPEAVMAFRREFPLVQLALQQGSPEQVTGWLLRGEAQIGIATESLAQHTELLAVPYYQWHHAAVVPLDHPLLQQALDIERLARWPLITYHLGFTGRRRIEEGFLRHGKRPNIVMSALDSDVIKTYVSCGLGVGVIAAMAFDPLRDLGLRKIDAGHLFGVNTTVIAFRRGQFLQGYAYRFAELCSAELRAERLRVAVESSSPLGGDTVGRAKRG
jgi:LysR family cys regulon transcriptional activator